MFGQVLFVELAGCSGDADDAVVVVVADDDDDVDDDDDDDAAADYFFFKPCKFMRFKSLQLPKLIHMSKLIFI